MRKLAFVAIVFMLGLAAARGQEPAPAVRFEAVDVYVDSGDRPLAAYQFEFAAETGEVKIVGIEGGDAPAFKAPPYYDPAALQQHRVIVAAFNTDADLPTGRTRVAKLHVMVAGDAEPQYAAQIEVAADADGQAVPATISLAEGGQDE